MWSKGSSRKNARQRKRQRARSGGKRVGVVRTVLALSLLGFLLFTMGAVGYVIFFRTVLA